MLPLRGRSRFKVHAPALAKVGPLKAKQAALRKRVEDADQSVKEARERAQELEAQIRDEEETVKRLGEMLALAEKIKDARSAISLKESELQVTKQRVRNLADNEERSLETVSWSHDCLLGEGAREPEESACLSMGVWRCLHQVEGIIKNLRREQSEKQRALDEARGEQQRYSKR